MGEFASSTLLLLVLLNPFALSVYLVDLLRSHTTKVVAGVLIRAALISGIVFAIFAVSGNQIFQDVLQVRFAAFQVFGGILFLLIAVRFMLSGGEALVMLRGEPQHIVGSIAMPFMIGPGTVSAAMLTGNSLGGWLGAASIGVALAITVAVLLFLKWLFDKLRTQRSELAERYTDIASRVTAIIVGTVAVDMVFQGLDTWLGRL